MPKKRKSRKEEIAKAIKLIGWYETSQRIKNQEDRKLFQELKDEFLSSSKARENERLKKAGISF